MLYLVTIKTKLRHVNVVLHGENTCKTLFKTAREYWSEGLLKAECKPLPNHHPFMEKEGYAYISEIN